MFRIFSLLLVMLLSHGVFAQKSKYKWPTDTAKARESLVLMTDDIKSKNYSSALNSFDWLYENAPDINKSLYINGVKIYQNLVKVTTDSSTKASYQEQVMKLYDQRLGLYGEESNVLPRKTKDAYRYYKSDPAKYDFIIGLIEKTYEIKKEKIHPNLLVGWIQMMYKNKRNNKVEYSEEEIIDTYGLIIAAIEKQKETASDKKIKSLNKIESTTNKLLNAMVKIDCEFIQSNFVTKFEENPEDLKAADYIVSLSLQAGCTKEPYFLKALQVRHKHAPTFGMANTIAKQFLAQGKMTEAEPYLDEAIELATDDAKKGQAVMYKANAYRKRGMKSKARATVYEAIKLKPELKKEGYNFIGNLYWKSFKDCKGGVDVVQDRAIYIAAYDMFQRAGNSKMMAECKKQFPSAVDIFEKNKNIGDPIHVGCWINETVKLKKR